MPSIRNPSNSTIIAVFWFALAILFSLMLASYTAQNRAYDNWLWVKHTQEVNLEIEELKSSYLSARVAWRNFLSSGHESDLQAYEAATKAVPLKVASLKNLTEDNPLQKERIGVLSILLNQDIAAIDSNISGKKRGKFVDPAAPFAPHLNWQKIKHIAEVIQDEEKDLLTRRSQELKSSTEYLAITIITGSIISFAMLMLVFYLLRREVRQRKAAQDALMESERHFRLLAASEKAVNEELESFSYSVSHDLRAPLRAINGFSRILNEDYGGKLDDEALRLLKVIRDSSTKMGILIDDLLAFSRLGRKPIAAMRIDMMTLVQSVKEELQNELKDRPVQMVIHDLPPAQGDSSLIRQVWINLLSNAMKFTSHAKSPYIEVACMEAGDEENKEGIGVIVYYVKDNGAGFDMRYYDKLFGIFHRLHREDEFPGTGVGLAIVQRIIVRHNGKIWAEGKVNEGAAFFFALPRGMNE